MTHREPAGLDLATALREARALLDAGRDDDARAAYLRVVERAPDHVPALNDLGTVLLRGGFRDAARTVYRRACDLAPTLPTVHANLAAVDFADGEYAAAEAGYRRALALDTEFAAAHQGLSYALVRLGREDEAVEHRRRGFAGRALTTAPYRGTAPPVDVLLIVAARGGTFYTDTFLDDRRFRVTTLVADAYDGMPPLPRVDVVVNAISDAERAADELHAAARWLATTASPVVNRPARVLETTRTRTAERLQHLPGVVAPRVRRVARAALADEAWPFPVIVRAPGYHTGEYCELAAGAAELTQTAAAFPGDDVLVIPFIDVRSSDGFVRKYRMLSIGGMLYPAHLAVADDWKVHYFRSRMAHDALHRAEEARFLTEPLAEIGSTAIGTLERIFAVVDLDYAGIDFALDANGNVVVFEANATMIVLPPGPGAMWDYRREPVDRIIAAFRAMLGAF